MTAGEEGIRAAKAEARGRTPIAAYLQPVGCAGIRLRVKWEDSEISRALYREHVAHLHRIAAAISEELGALHASHPTVEAGDAEGAVLVELERIEDLQLLIAAMRRAATPVIGFNPTGCP